MKPQISTLCDLVYVTIPHFNQPNCLMVKKGGSYVNISAAEVVETVESLAAGLLKMGVTKGDRIGLLSENRPEWAYSDLATLCIGAISVPIYGSLPPRQIQYIMNDSEMRIIFVSSESQLQKILEIKSNLPQLRKIIVFDLIPSLPQDVISFSSALQEGKEFRKKEPSMVRNISNEVKPDDVFTLVYTSGTTGEPKGVMLTHRNVVSNIEAASSIFNFGTGDCALSFLPLSHIFERMAGYYTTLREGCVIAYAESIDTLAKNLAEVRPTVFMSVPRVYEKFYSRIRDNVAAARGFKKALAEWALRVASKYTERKLANQAPGPLLAIQYAIADRLVFAKIRRLLGGRLRLLVSGGGALPKQLATFFYGIGLTILEGYGLTETSPVISCNRPDNFKFGTVGPPISGVEVKIADDGEIWTRGSHVMKGYYNKPEATAEAITPDGWFRTGDIGEIDSEGFLRITDRKKDLIKTSGGKYIAPQFVENTLKTSRYIAQIVIIGEKRKFPSALIVPNLENVRKFAAANRITDSEMLTHPKIIAEIKSDIDRLSQDLASFERVKKIALVPQEFTIESGELTPSLKIKRAVVEKRYKDLIDSMYSAEY